MSESNRQSPTSTTFELDYSHGQILIALAKLKRPFNTWSDDSVQQGFAWRRGSCAFRLPDDLLSCTVRVLVSDLPTPEELSANYRVRLPFKPAGTAGIQVCSVIATVILDLAPATNVLWFSRSLDSDKLLCTFRLSSETDDRPEMLTTDLGNLISRDRLRLDAVEAT